MVISVVTAVGVAAWFLAPQARGSTGTIVGALLTLLVASRPQPSADEQLKIRVRGYVASAGWAPAAQQTPLLSATVRMAGMVKPRQAEMSVDAIGAKVVECVANSAPLTWLLGLSEQESEDAARLIARRLANDFTPFVVHSAELVRVDYAMELLLRSRLGYRRKLSREFWGQISPAVILIASDDAHTIAADLEAVERFVSIAAAGPLIVIGSLSQAREMQSQSLRFLGNEISVKMADLAEVSSRLAEVARTVAPTQAACLSRLSDRIANQNEWWLAEMLSTTDVIRAIAEMPTDQLVILCDAREPAAVRNLVAWQQVRSATRAFPIVRGKRSVVSGVRRLASTGVGEPIDVFRAPHAMYGRRLVLLLCARTAAIAGCILGALTFASAMTAVLIHHFNPASVNSAQLWWCLRMLVLIASISLAVILTATWICVIVTWPSYGRRRIGRALEAAAICCAAGAVGLVGGYEGWVDAVGIALSVACCFAARKLLAKSDLVRDHLLFSLILGSAWVLRSEPLSWTLPVVTLNYFLARGLVRRAPVGFVVGSVSADLALHFVISRLSLHGHSWLSPSMAIGAVLTLGACVSLLIELGTLGRWSRLVCGFFCAIVTVYSAWSSIADSAKDLKQMDRFIESLSRSFGYKPPLSLFVRMTPMSVWLTIFVVALCVALFALAIISNENTYLIVPMITLLSGAWYVDSRLVIASIVCALTIRVRQLPLFAIQWRPVPRLLWPTAAVAGFLLWRSLYVPSGPIRIYPNTGTIYGVLLATRTAFAIYAVVLVALILTPQVHDRWISSRWRIRTWSHSQIVVMYLAGFAVTVYAIYNADTRSLGRSLTLEIAACSCMLFVLVRCGFLRVTGVLPIAVPLLFAATGQGAMLWVFCAFVVLGGPDGILLRKVSRPTWKFGSLGLLAAVAVTIDYGGGNLSRITPSLSLMVEDALVLFAISCIRSDESAATLEWDDIKISMQRVTRWIRVVFVAIALLIAAGCAVCLTLLITHPRTAYISSESTVTTSVTVAGITTTQTVSSNVPLVIAQAVEIVWLDGIAVAVVAICIAIIALCTVGERGLELLAIDGLGWRRRLESRQVMDRLVAGGLLRQRGLTFAVASQEHARWLAAEHTDAPLLTS
jgi:hypothetical protein